MQACVAYDGNGPKDVVVRYSVGTACMASSAASMTAIEVRTYPVESAWKLDKVVEHGAVVVEVVLVRRVIVTTGYQIMLVVK